MILPPSKSIALRQLAAAFVLTGNRSFLHILYPAQRGACDDIRYLAEALTQLTSMLPENTWSAAGSDRVETPSSSVFIGEGAAPMRFFTAIAASTPGVKLTLLGDGKLPVRPHTPLIEALRQAGAYIQVLPPSTHRPAPLLLISGNALQGGEIEVDVALSSQYLSALMLAAPLWKQGANIRFSGGDTPVSFPYVKMTAEVMQSLGFEVSIGKGYVHIPHRDHSPLPANIPVCETDWSAASYFYGAVSVFRLPEIFIPHLTAPNRSMQGDAICSALFRPLGVVSEFTPEGAFLRYEEVKDLKNYEADLTDCPDLAPALVTALCLTHTPFRITGTRNLRFKECDRAAALVEELGKLGYHLHADDDVISFSPEGYKAPIKPVILHSHNDHRMVMALSIALPLYPHCRIDSTDAVTKSFPDFLTRFGECLGNSHIHPTINNQKSTIKD